jgi:hypothetical protein
MAKMNQPGTDKGIRAESGEKLPKGAAKADTSGERTGKIKEGVALGKADATGEAVTGKGRPESHMGKHDGRLGEHNMGNVGETVIYEHKRVGHDQDGM